MGAGRSNKVPNASEGRDLATTDFALGVGWGDGAVTKTLATSSKQNAFQIVVTSVGSNQAQATATIVLTYPIPYAVAPIAIVTTTNSNSIDTGHATWSSTTTALTITHSVIPVAAAIYKFNVALFSIG